MSTIAYSCNRLRRSSRELGEGGIGTVYLADDLRHERKKMFTHLLTQPQIN